MNIKPLPSPTQPVIDAAGKMTTVWYDYFKSRESIGLANLTDVSVSGATNGQYLTYNSSTHQWSPTTLSLALNDLSDVDTTGVQVGYTIKYIPSNIWLATAP